MKIYKITENDANQRLDKFLKKLLPNSSLSLIYKLNRKNKVKVNYKKQDNEYKLQIGDEIKLFISDEELNILSVQKKDSDNLDKKFFLDKKDIVFEDSEILIVNKNPGISVHPGDFKTKDLSLIQMVHDYLGNKLNSLTFKPSLVHRIDKDTSGIVLIAKTKPTLDNLLLQLQNNKIDKYYLAIVNGKPEKNEGTINKRILRIENAKNENKVKIDELGQKAITHYKVIQSGIKDYYSLIECKIETGRMHQIRIHLASIGCPILGDKTYGNKILNIDINKKYSINRQLLHAYKISFIHPKTKKSLTFEARLKDDMQNLIS